MKILSERSKKIIEQKKHKGSVLFAESAHNEQNAQIGLVVVSNAKEWKDIVNEFVIQNFRKISAHATASFQ